MPEDDDMSENEFDGYLKLDDDARDSNADSFEREAKDSEEFENGPSIPAFDRPSDCAEDMSNASPLKFCSLSPMKCVSVLSNR